MAVAAYQGLAGRIVRTIQPSTEADPVALLVHVLTEFSCVLGRKPKIRIDGSLTTLPLFTALIGQTSKARKGSAQKRVRPIFKKAFPTWSRGEYRGTLSSGEGLVFAVRDSMGEDPGVTDKRLYVVESEFGSAMKIMAREGNSLSGILREAWDGEDLAPMTKHTRIRATRPHIAITGHVTEVELHKHLTSTEAANGFGNRFMWFMVKRSQVLPFPGAQDRTAMASLVKMLQKAVAFARGTFTIRMSLLARKAWASVYPYLSEGRPGLAGELTARGEAQVLRMAALYALLGHSKVIKAVHLKAALAVWQYCEDSVRYLYGEQFGDPTIDKISEALRNAGPKGLSDDEIYELFSRNKSKKERDRALDTLQAAGLVYAVIVKTKGRPARVWKSLRYVEYVQRGKKDREGSHG